MARKLLVLVLVVLSLLCAGCDDVDKIVEDIDDGQFAEDVNAAYDDTVEAVEDYVEEMVDDAVNMTEVLAEENMPKVSPEASQDAREGVIDALDTVGQAVLSADEAARELEACFQQCDGDYPDIAGSKVLANLDCVAECKGQ